MQWFQSAPSKVLGAGMKDSNMSTPSNIATPSAPSIPASPKTVEKDWSKEKANRLNLPRFNSETTLLCQLVPSGTSDEVTVKAIDWLRTELAKLASDSANAGELGKVSKLSKKDGTRKITVKGESIERRETAATWIARIAKVRVDLAKEVGCDSVEVKLPEHSKLALEVENLVLRLTK